MPATSMPEATQRELTVRLKKDQDAFLAHYPGESGVRQPVHTVYGGAHLFKSDTTRKLGELALRALATYAPDGATLAEAIGLDPSLGNTVHARVTEKLRREAVEDFRIDFEDGYGNRPDAEEDGHAVQAGEELAKGMAAGTLPPFIGIRTKTFSSEVSARSMRTLDLFLTALTGKSGGKLPANFVVTLPKVTSPDQTAALADFFDAIEPKLGLAKGALKLENMIETTQAIMDPSGQSMLPKLLTAARGRCVAAHFGT